MSGRETLQDYACKLLELGYTPLRIDPDSKAARAVGWQHETPTEDTLRRQFARPSNIGLRCGDIHKDGSCLVAIDVDLENADLIRCVTRAVGDASVPVKKGKKGATWMLRIDREVKTGKVQWVRDGKKTDAIDILGRGAQTVIPPSIHPDIKLPYRWVSGTPIDQIDYRTLPIFGPALLDEIRGFCKDPEDPIFALNDMEWRGVGGGGNTHDICVRAVASMVSRGWKDEDTHSRIQRAKLEACEASGMPYNWPEASKRIQEWIDSSRNKKFDEAKQKRGKPDDVPPEMINRYVSVAGIDRMYDRVKGVNLNKQVFDNVHSRDVAKPWISCLMHDDFKIVDKITYAPGKPMFCTERGLDSDGTLDCYNTYMPPDIEPNDGDVSPFLDLVAEVLDKDEDAIRHVLQFFAYAVKHPDEQIRHALVLQGDQGIGKDSILRAVKLVVGTHNCGEVTLKQVESQFNEWLFGKRFIIFQEMMAAGRRNIYNSLKTYITDPYHVVNTKHMTLRTIPNVSFYVFLTNYVHALSLDPHDRRLWVHHSKAVPKPSGYFDSYYRWLRDKNTPGALLNFFQKYDTMDFNPDASPPMTDAKLAMIRQSSNEIEQFLRSAAEQGVWPMGCDLVNVNHLHGSLRQVMRASLGMIEEALDHIAPDGKLEARPYIGPTRLRLRAIRNVEKWRSASPGQLAKEYRMPLPPMQGETEGRYQEYSGEGVEGDSPDARY